jgi:DNA-binding transcriptional MerR regulator
MTEQRRYQVKELAKLAGVSVRALHHYDSIGLLAPADRTDAGYRLYNGADLLRLQQILINRELGFSLETIRRRLDDPLFDHRQALLRQREELAARAERTRQMIHAVDAALSALQEESTMDPKEIFGGFDPTPYEDEVKGRWGDTNAYRESARRTQGYSAEDWARYKSESDAIMKEAAAAMRAGKQPDDVEAVAIAERHRLSIDQWFYPCSPQMHAGLADMYESDGRFAANIDTCGEGLTPWWSAAIRANARQQGG